MEKLAVNLFDLDRVEPALRRHLLAGRVNLQAPIVVSKNKLRDTALVFTCGLFEAACILDTMRLHDRELGDTPTAAYIQNREGGRWIKLPAEAVLTIGVMGEDKAITMVLNSYWFPSVRPGPVPALPPTPVKVL